MTRQQRAWGCIVATMAFMAGIMGEPLIVTDRSPINWIDGFVFGVLLTAVAVLLTLEPKWESKPEEREVGK